MEKVRESQVKNSSFLKTLSMCFKISSLIFMLNFSYHSFHTEKRKLFLRNCFENRCSGWRQSVVFSMTPIHQQPPVTKADTKRKQLKQCKLVLAVTHLVSLIIWCYQIKSCGYIFAPLFICLLKTWVDYVTF